MRKTILPITLLLILSANTFSQQIERHQADSLLHRLNRADSNVERIHILIRLAQFYIFKPGENPIDFDSASACLAEARRLNGSTRSPSLAAQSLLTESYMLREEGQKNEAMQKLDTAIKTLQSGDDTYYLGKVLYELSGYYDYHDSAGLVKKSDLVARSVTAFHQSDSIREEADALKMLGDLYHIKGDPARAIETLQQSLTAYQSINYKALQGVYDLLGGIYLEKGEYKQSLYYELLALRAAQDCHDTTIQLCSINSSLAGLYSFSGRDDLAIKFFRSALETAIKYEDRFAIALTVYNISTAYYYLDRSGELLDFLSTIPPKFLQPAPPPEKAFFALSYLEGYLGARQYKFAGEYCNRLLTMLDEPGMPPGIKNIIHRLVTSYYMETRQFSRARLYLTRNKPITANMAEGKRARSLDEKLWYKIDSAEGNYEDAFYHLHNYKAISDSLFTETKTRQIQQLEVEYETAQKEDSLRSKDQMISLLTQKNDLQQLSLRQATLLRNITIAGIISSFIVIGLLYHQYRNNRRNNKIILQKNQQLKDMLAEKEWWLKEVHHRVKNNLHTIICLLESQAMYLEKDALQAIEKSQQRIYAMSLIHQKLYQNEDVSSIDMSVYLDEFIGHLKKSFDVDRIGFVIRVEPIHLNLSQAVPVALIINEAVTNSIKYAFTCVADARINLFMYERDEFVHLTISDNGIGFTPTEDIETKSLGLQLIKGLGREIRGVVSINGNRGTTINIQFKKQTILSTEQFMQKEMETYES